jgi:group I intron endonuclease
MLYTATIYSITNTITNTVYIGQTLRDPAQRWREHKYSFTSKKIGVNLYLKFSYLKHGKNAFVFSIVTFNSFDNLLEAKNWANTQEDFYIQQYKNNSVKLYNIRPSCVSNAGCVRSEELKKQVAKKCSIALKGRIFTEEHKANISKAKKRKTLYHKRNKTKRCCLE